MDKTKEQYDFMTKTPVSKLILKLSVPTILSMLSTTIYNLVDTAFVGTLGNEASGAVGVVFGFMAILQAVGFMFGQGAGSLLSRKLGEKDPDAANVIASTGFFGSFATATLVMILCVIFIDPLVMFLGSTETIAPYAKIYIRFILCVSPFMASCFTMNNILRYEGKAKLGMIGLISGGVINILGDAIFMFGFKMGIAGAGLSTALSQFISFVILLSMFLRGKTQCKISIKKVSAKKLLPLDIMATGFPSLLRQCLGSLGTILLNIEVAKNAPFAADPIIYAYNQDASVAAMSIVSRIGFAIFSCSLGIGQAFQPVCGFNYGAKKYKRLRDAYKFTMKLALALLLGFTVVVVIFTGPIVRVFRNDDLVVEIGTRALRLLCVAQLFVPVCMTTEMLMQSSGRRRIAAFLSSLRGGIIYLPALIILANIRGLEGVQEAQPLAYVLSVLPAVFFARKYFREIPKEDS